MKLVELSIFEFDEFAKKHPLGNYRETSQYAMYKAEQKYDYDLIGLKDDNNNLIGASIILIKRLNFISQYAYAPRGFLLDYYDDNILRIFTELVRKRYYMKNVAFIKINPEIAVGELDLKAKQIKYNKNLGIKDKLKRNGYTELIEELSFESMVPKYSAILLLKKATLSSYNKNTRNKIHKSLKNGLSLVKATREQMPILYNFIKNKKKDNINHYYHYYNAFSKGELIDIFLVKIDFAVCLESIKRLYELETEHNQELAENLFKNNNSDNLKKKIDSDNILNSYNNMLARINQDLIQNQELYIAGAVTIKYKDRINVIISGYDSNYKDLCSNYFLYYSMIEYYKKDYNFMDFNGISGNFNDNNPYKGLDEFKLGFKPKVFENIGEYDFVINKGLYDNLNANGILAEEFAKEIKSINQQD